MAERMILGLVHEATPTADILDELRKLGISEERISIMSGIPYSAQMLGRKPHYERLVPIALLGALGGLMIGLFFTVVTPLLYPQYVGGQPIVPGPPSIIICFEMTMLGTMFATFFGMLAELRFPLFGRKVYDPRITEGHIGVLVRVDQRIEDQVVMVLEASGGHHLQRLPAENEPIHLPSLLPRLGFVFALLLIPSAIMLAVAYSFVEIPLPNQMVDQPSIGLEQGPRLGAPAAAVPVQGPALIAGKPASRNLPADAASVARGKTLFTYNCVMCHGETGEGNGRLNGFFNPKPANLTSAAVQNLSDNEIFMVLTNGKNQMPPQREGLLAAERWDVIDYVRTLKK